MVQGPDGFLSVWKPNARERENERKELERHWTLIRSLVGATILHVQEIDAEVLEILLMDGRKIVVASNGAAECSSYLTFFEEGKPPIGVYD